MEGPFPKDRLLAETEDTWIYDYVQGSDEWLSARKGGIGGSGICGIIGGSHYVTRLQAIARLEYDPKITITSAIARGSVGESYVRDYLGKVLGIQYRECGIGVYKKAPWMRASPDGLYDLPHGGTGILEIKIVSGWGRRAEVEAGIRSVISGNGNVPGELGAMFEEHRHQVNYTAGVFGAREITYAVLLWGTGSDQDSRLLVVRRFSPDQELFQGMHTSVAMHARGGE